ncbi:hypothetical protein SLEP1_g19623 [Rubroshorea leprosula]|uniref:Uncharacterized protein n=1 Tax=Rubroshorea leprosula TaxID=152421 RepID=A0AAV5J7L1_9ROSI|nr:hypothetical protein SLEP1_g19623 [Rubroshorea leprosula]
MMDRQAVIALPIAVIFTIAAMHPSLKVCSSKDVGQCSFSVFSGFLLTAAMICHVYLLTRLSNKVLTLPLITFYCLWFWVYVGHLTKDVQQLRCPFTSFVMSKPLALGMASAIFLLLLRPSRITAPCTVLCCIWLLVYLVL